MVTIGDETEVTVGEANHGGTLIAAQHRKQRSFVRRPRLTKIGRHIFWRPTVHTGVLAADGKQIAFVIEWHDGGMPRAGAPRHLAPMLPVIRAAPEEAIVTFGVHREVNRLVAAA